MVHGAKSIAFGLSVLFPEAQLSDAAHELEDLLAHKLAFAERFD
jgi:hypothetical protein